VVVNCGQGGTLASASVADALTIEFVGTCNETLVVQRGNLTIRGSNSTAVIQGSLSFERTAPSSEALADGPVTLENFSITLSPGYALTVGPEGHVAARNLEVTNSAKDGIRVHGGGWPRCIDCQSTNNGSHGLDVTSMVRSSSAATALFRTTRTSESLQSPPRR
jgi:hypothetical protein